MFHVSGFTFLWLKPFLVSRFNAYGVSMFQVSMAAPFQVSGFSLHVSGFLRFAVSGFWFNGYDVSRFAVSGFWG